MTAHEFYREPVFGAGVTVLAYVMGTHAHRRWPWAHALLVTCGLLILLMLTLHIPYESYKIGGGIVSFFLGPATVALGVPLYKQATRIKRHLPAILTAVTAGAVAGMLSAAGVAKLLGASPPVVLSVLPKSVTTPISMAIARQIGGVPDLAALATVLSGLLGSIVGPAVLRAVGVRRDIPVAVAMGTSSHGIGTARMIHQSELRGGTSGLSMALAGIVTSIVVAAAWAFYH